MINHKDNPAEIFLVPIFDDDVDHAWCDTPAPGEGMKEEDATRYVRADLVPESNSVLAERIADLTRQNSGLAKQNSEQSKVIEHIAKAFNDEKDTMACHEYVDLLISQHESTAMELHASCAREGKQHETIAELQAQLEQLLTRMHTAERIEKIFADAPDLTFGSCLQMFDTEIAEVRAQAVDDAIPEECPHMIVFEDADREPITFAGNGAKEAAINTYKKISLNWNAHLFVRIECNTRDDKYPSANQLRQPAKAGE